MRFEQGRGRDIAATNQFNAINPSMKINQMREIRPSCFHRQQLASRKSLVGHPVMIALGGGSWGEDASSKNHVDTIRLIVFVDTCSAVYRSSIATALDAETHTDIHACTAHMNTTNYTLINFVRRSDRIQIAASISFTHTHTHGMTQCAP